VRRFCHILILVFAAALAAGALFSLLSPLPRRAGPAPGRQPDPAPPAANVSLLLDSSPADRSGRSGRSEFGFGERIYATVEIERVAPGDHLLTFRWFNPRGGLQETFRRPFSSPGRSYRAWSWLELRGDEWLGFPLGPLGPGRFLGRWRVEAVLDGAPLAESAFTVR